LLMCAKTGNAGRNFGHTNKKSRIWVYEWWLEQRAGRNFGQPLKKWKWV
jgi:hypothetical protein